MADEYKKGTYRDLVVPHAMGDGDFNTLNVFEKNPELQKEVFKDEDTYKRYKKFQTVGSKEVTGLLYAEDELGAQLRRDYGVDNEAIRKLTADLRSSFAELAKQEKMKVLASNLLKEQKNSPLPPL